MKSGDCCSRALAIALFGASQLIATGGDDPRREASATSSSDFTRRRRSAEQAAGRHVPRRHPRLRRRRSISAVRRRRRRMPASRSTSGTAAKTPDDGWAVFYDNFADLQRPTSTMRAAICGKAMPRYRPAGFVPRPGRYVTKPVACPRGTFAWGGGASNRGPYDTMYLSETAPLRGRAVGVDGRQRRPRRVLQRRCLRDLRAASADVRAWLDLASPDSGRDPGRGVPDPASPCDRRRRDPHGSRPHRHRRASTPRTPTATSTTRPMTSLPGGARQLHRTAEADDGHTSSASFAERRI